MLTWRPILLLDGFDDEYELAVVVSNDSDLELPIRKARVRLSKQVGVIDPSRRRNFQLYSAASLVQAPPRRPAEREPVPRCAIGRARALSRSPAAGEGRPTGRLGRRVIVGRARPFYNINAFGAACVGASAWRAGAARAGGGYRYAARGGGRSFPLGENNEVVGAAQGAVRGRLGAATGAGGAVEAGAAAGGLRGSVAHHHRHAGRRRHRARHHGGGAAAAGEPARRPGSGGQGGVPPHRRADHREPRRQTPGHPRRRARGHQGVPRYAQGADAHAGAGRRLPEHRERQRRYAQGARPVRQRPPRPHPR